jgi:hypothetical protein
MAIQNFRILLLVIMFLCYYVLPVEIPSVWTKKTTTPEEETVDLEGKDMKVG